MRDIEMRNRVKALVYLSIILLAPCQAFIRAQDSTAPANSGEAKSSKLLQLEKPDVVKELKLTAEQITKISVLFNQRKEQLAAAKPEEQEKISTENLKLLSEVLTEVQRKQLEQIGVEPKLIFNFRYQRWTDVLDWFATQSNLSLTMDAPPPGTFNYTDKNEYTPSEAIDLLNGVLQSKSYTLIRRNKMLLVLDISEGIQDSLIPKISLEELSKRGQFEYVSAIFPMEGRTAEEASKEIEPLLGQHGKIVVLQKTNQLMVTEMAGRMKSFEAIIKSIPLPPKPKKEEKPPVPELKSYDVKTLDSTATIQTLEKLFGEIKAVYDPKTNKLRAFTVPGQQAAIKKVLEQLQAGESATEYRLSVYDMTNENPAVLMENIQLVIPGVRLRHDTVNNTLVAWASPEEHKKIKETIEKLSQNQSGDKSNQVEIYSTRGLDANSTLVTLQSLFPHAKLTLEGKSQGLIVIAPTSVHQGIKAILEQFKAVQTKIELPQLKFYPYDSEKLPAGVTEILAQAVAKASVRIDIETKQLIVLATSAEHAKIESVLKQYIAAAEKTKKTKQLEIYSVNKQQQTRLAAMLATIQAELPGMSITTDTQSGEIAVWGTADQHLILVSILEKLKSEKAEDQQFQLSTYPLKKSDPASVQAMLTNLYPTTNIILDSSTNRLLVWATAEEQKSIAQSMEKLVSDKSPDKQSRLDTYTVSGMPVSELITILQPLVPSARLTADTKSDSMIAWGTPDDHEKIQIAVARMGKNNTPQNSPQLEVYKLTKIDPSATLTLLQGLFPNAKLTVDPQSKSLISIAKPSDQAAIKNTLNELQPSKSSPNAEKLQFHSLTMKPSDNLMTILQALAPQAKITLEAESKRVMAVATDEDHQTIKETIEKIEGSTTAKTKNRLEIYSVSPAQRKRFMAIYTAIQAEIPGIQVVTDAEPGELSIWAKPEQHEMLKEIISKLNKKVSKGKRYVLLAYSLKDADPQSALDVMTKLFPETKIVLDPETARLLIWTSPDQHEMIQQAIEQIATGQNSDSVKSYQTYPIKKADMSILSAIVQEMFPRVTLKSDTTARTLIIRAKKSEHKKVTELIKQLDKATSNANEVRLYPTGNADSSSIYNVIYRLVPLASVNLDYVSGNLIVYGSKEDQEIVTSAMKKIVGEDFKNTPRTMQVYKLKTIISYYAQQIIVNAVPKAKISQGSDDKKMIVWAQEHEHKIIGDIIAKIDIDDHPHENRILAIIPLNGIDYSTMMTFLDEGLKKETQFIEDTIEDSVIVRGKEKQISKIKKALEEFIEKLPKKDKPVLKIYKTKSIDPSLAISLVRSYVPRASFTLDSKENRILAQAIPKDHKTIVETLELIDTKEEKENAPFLKAHRVSDNNLATINQLITNAFVNEQEYRITQDSINSRMVIFASEEQHQKISEIIEKFDNEESASTTVLYKLKHTTPPTINSISSYLIPKAKLTWASSNNILYSYATKEDQARMKDLVAKMDVSDDEKDATLKTYDISPENFSTTSTIINSMMAKEINHLITSDTINNRLIILASEEQHEKIAKVLEKLKTENGKSRAVIYSLKHISNRIIRNLINSIAPYANVSLDNPNNKLIIYANDKDHEKIEAIIASMDVDSDENPPRIKTYTVNSSNISTAYSVISQLMNGKQNVQINQDSANNRLVVFATDEDHKKIEAALKEIDKDVTESFTEVYQLKHTLPTTINGVVMNLVPGVKISVDNENKNLIVQGSEEDHEKVRKLIEKVDVTGTEQGKPYLAAYPINKADPNNLQNIFRNTIRNGKNVAISVDDKAGTLVVFAREKEHEEISKLLKQFDEVTPGLSSDVYRFKYADPQSALYPLTTLTPRARIAVDTKTRSLIVTASERDHKLIKEAIAKLDNKDASDPDGVFKIYSIKNAEPYNTLSMLQSLFARHPEVRITLDSKNNSIAAVALPDQHEKIAAYLEEIDNNAKGQLSKVYKLHYADAASAYTVLRNLVPSAASVTDAISNSLIVSATEADHKKIQKMIDEMEKNSSEADEKELKYYTLIKADLSTVYQALYQTYYNNSKIRITMDQRNNAVVVNALPEYHEKIAKQIKKIEEESKGVTSTVYRLKKADPRSISSIISRLAPQATVAPDDNTRSLVVTASEADHLRIKEILDQIDTDSENDLVLQAYEIKNSEASNLVTMLRNLFNNNREVRISYDTKNNTVIALASVDQHKQIHEFLTKVESKAKKLSTVVYRFQQADPYIAYSVLYRLLPKVTFSYDQPSKTLLATGTEEDHATIAKTVKEFDAGESSEYAPKLVIYPIRKADSSSLQSMIRSLFSRNSNVTISYDQKNDSLVVMAPDFQQKKIQKLIDQIEKEATGRPASELVSYPLDNIKARSVMTMLKQLFQSQTPKVELSVAPDSNVLLAIARKEQHELIRSTIEKLRIEKPELEVFQLLNVDPVTADSAISQLFDIYGSDSGGLSVDYDYESEQLFVRGSKEQIEEIRKLLIKMGETQLRFSKSDQTSRIRVIPFSGNSEEVLEQIQKVWPRLRKNQIRIVTPSAVAPFLRKSKKETNKNNPSDKKAPVKKEENTMLERVGDELIETEFVFFEEVDQVTEEKKETPKKKPVKKKSTEKQPDTESKKTVKNESSPVLISPGVDSITIASDDIEALNQLESLLRNLAPHKSRRSSDFIIFQLKNSLAATVAKNLEGLFKKGNNNRRSSSSKRVRIVPDERLNAIIVYGSRKDLESIEELIQFLDTEDATETFASQKPYLIQVKNTQASRIEILLHEVYRSQLLQRPSRNQIQFVIPTGVSPEVASALVQANTARSAPLLSISVDELTNSLIISSPKALYEEIKELVTELDEKAGNNTTRGMTVVPLKKVNSKEMRRVLNRLIKSQNRTRSRRRNR